LWQRICLRFFYILRLRKAGFKDNELLKTTKTVFRL
jgi:hypothetical protein